MSIADTALTQAASSWADLRDLRGYGRFASWLARTFRGIGAGMEQGGCPKGGDHQRQQRRWPSRPTRRDETRPSRFDGQRLETANRHEFVDGDDVLIHGPRRVNFHREQGHGIPAPDADGLAAGPTCALASMHPGRTAGAAWLARSGGHGTPTDQTGRSSERAAV